MYWRLTPFGCRVICKLSHPSVAFLSCEQFPLCCCDRPGARPQRRPHQAPTPEPRWWAVRMWRPVRPPEFWVRLRRAIRVETKRK